MNPSPGKRQEFTQAIASLVKSIRGVTGCLRCDFCCSVEDQNELYLYCEWESDEVLAGHLQSQYFKVLLGAMTLLHHPYEVRVYTGAPESQTIELLSLF